MSGTGLYTVRRPDRFHAKLTGGRNIESWYNGKVLTMAAHQDKVFAQAPMPENINRTLDALAERYDMALPMGDLFYGPAAEGAAFRCDHGRRRQGGWRRYMPATTCQFQDTGADFELWLPVEGEPLPKRFSSELQLEQCAQAFPDVGENLEGAFASKTTRRASQSRFFTWSARTTPVIVPAAGSATSKG